MDTTEIKDQISNIDAQISELLLMKANLQQQLKHIPTAIPHYDVDPALNYGRKYNPFITKHDAEANTVEFSMKVMDDVKSMYNDEVYEILRSIDKYTPNIHITKQDIYDVLSEIPEKIETEFTRNIRTFSQHALNDAYSSLY